MFGSYPGLIAAHRVFLRLPMPRHPPSALFILVLLSTRSMSYTALAHGKDLLILPFLPYSIVKERTPKGLPDFRLDDITKSA